MNTFVKGPTIRCATHDHMGEKYCRIAHPQELDTCRVYHVACSSVSETRVARKARLLSERRTSYDQLAARIPGFTEVYPRP